MNRAEIACLIIIGALSLVSWIDYSHTHRKQRLRRKAWKESTKRSK